MVATFAQSGVGGLSYSGTRRERYEQRLTSLRSARQSWEPTWRQICAQLNPYGVLLDRTKRGRGDKEEGLILNNKPVLALQILAAGMMAGMTSPARDWFGLSTVDPELAEWRDVKVWLDKAEEVVKARLARGGWYTGLSNGTYLHLGSIGQGFMFQEDDGAGGSRYDPRPIGEYFLDQDHMGRIDTAYRDLDLNVRQVMMKFGRAAVSQTVRNLWDQSKYDTPVPVVHAIQPNDQLESGRAGYRGMRFASCWFEPGNDDKNAFLREHGYVGFPALAPRWSVRPGDVYGRGPGWSARGDCQVLQHHEKAKLVLLDKIKDPPMKVSESVGQASLLPGARLNLPTGEDVIAEPLFDLAPLAAALERIMQHIEATENRIENTFYVDLWQTFINDERAERQTATEVEAKREERMLILGPLLENLNGGLFEPAIEREVDMALRADELPPPPEELLRSELKIKFTSIMHQMQQVTGLAGIRTLVDEVGRVAELRPDVVDNLNGDVIAQEILRISGARSDSLLAKDEVAAVRRQKAEQAQANATRQAAVEESQGLKNLSSFDPQKLSDVAGALAPVAQAQGGALSPATGA